jgi:methionine-rich copper-binding protein CopC
MAAVAIGAAAQAHPVLKSASPSPNSAVRVSPAEVRLTFSEAVIPAFSGVKLTDASGKAVLMGPARKEGKQLIVPIKSKLTQGRYQLAWHSVADDTHRVRGAYNFTIAR